MGYADIEKKREYQLDWVRKRKAEFMSEASCSRCGSQEDIHIHHKDPEKKFSHRIWSYSKERIAEELEKCEMLCGDCHRIHHKQQTLNDEDVIQIRQRIKTGEKHPSIAKDFGVCRSTISKIGRGEVWKKIAADDYHDEQKKMA